LAEEINMTPKNNITGSAEVQLGWTALVENFSNHWLGCGMSAEDLNIYVGVPAYRFRDTGWLREEFRAEGHLFWPAGQLQAALLREVEQAMRDVTDVAEPVHVSTVPFPHVVEPTPTETIAARQIESRPSQSSPATAGAVAVAYPRGRWDATVVHESGLTKDLSDMIGVLKVAGDSVRERLMEITMEQQDANWPERTKVLNAVAHLRRLASDLFNELSDFELKSQLHFTSRR
jgi:hypothetical protein